MASIDESRRDAIPGDAYDDPNLLPEETDPATGETADDALEASRSEPRRDVPEYLMPAEDASPRAIDWSTHPTQDSTQEAEWREPLTSPTNAETAEDDGGSDLFSEVGTSNGVDRIVDESYFLHEEDDLNDAEDDALLRAATDDDPHPGSQTPDPSDADTLLDEGETRRGKSSGE